MGLGQRESKDTKKRPPRKAAVVVSGVWERR